MLFKKTRELQSLEEARTKSLKDAEDKIVNLTRQNKELSEERTSNIARIYSCEEILKEILEVIEQNPYNRTDGQKLNKIKELATTGIN